MKKSKIVQEQTTPKLGFKEFFAKAKEFGCLTDDGLIIDKVYQRKSDANTPKVYIKGPSKSMQGKEKRVYSDFTVEVIDPQTKEVLKKGTWACQKIVDYLKPVPQEDPREVEKKKQLEELKKYFDAWVEKYKQQRGEGANVKSELDATDVEKNTWEKIAIPGSKDKFGVEKYVYIDKKSKYTGSADDTKNSPVSGLDDKTCEALILNWFENYKTRPDDFDDAWFQKERPKVMFCKRKFYKNWGINLKANKLNKIIDLMSRGELTQYDGAVQPPRVAQPGSNKHLWKLDEMKLEKTLRKKLVETKKLKKEILIQENIVKSRIAMIASEDQIKNFDNLSEESKNKIADQLISEIIEINESGLVNEQLGDMLKSLFGNSFSGIWKTAVERVIHSALSMIGVEDGFLKDVVVQYFSNHPIDAIKSLGDCRKMTEMIVSSTVEALVVKYQRESNKGGMFLDLLRNTVFETLTTNETIKKLSDSLEDVVCQILGKFTGKAKEVFSKVGPQLATATN